MNNTEDKISDPLYSGLDSKTADQGFKDTGGAAFARCIPGGKNITKKQVQDFWDKCDRMFGPIDQKKLDNLSDELVDNVMRTPAYELMKECEEDYGDPVYLANRARAILRKSQKRAKGK